METFTIEFSLGRVNLSDETIRVGALTVHFLIFGETSSHTVDVFELFVPGGESLPVPAPADDKLSFARSIPLQ